MHNVGEATRNDIAAAFDREQRSKRVAIGPHDIPINYDLIDPDWLTYIVCKNHPAARVVGFRAEAPDNLNRGHMRIFLEYNEAGATTGLPSAIFCKDSQALDVRIFNAKCDTIRGEIVFYNEIRPLLDNETPRSLFAEYDLRTHNSIVVMNDLLLEGAVFCTPASVISRAAVESQLGYLARMHGKFYGKLDRYPLLQGLRTFADATLRYDSTLNLAQATHRGFIESEQLIPPRLFKRDTEIWPLTLQAIDLHRTRPLTFAHNDAHLKNWYAAADGDMRLADWQCNALAYWAFDVAFALSTSLSVENRRAWEQDLLRFYLEEMRESGAPVMEFADAWDCYRTQLLIALCWWTPCVKHDLDFEYHPIKETLEIIRRVATAIDDLDALDSFS